MKEIRTVCVNGRQIPVLISDENEALLAAKAAGGAIVGLWRPETEGGKFSPAPYVVEDRADITEEFLERVARRSLGFPWRICETDRLRIRELSGDDFDLVRDEQVAAGFKTTEEFLAYTCHQYEFYEFGLWALVEKEFGELVGVAGLFVPDEATDDVADGIANNKQYHYSDNIKILTRAAGGDPQTILELGYHIFRPYRRKGFAREACEAILRYGEERLEVGGFIVRIKEENTASLRLACRLGFVPSK